ncbi:hypothetical protein MLD52_09490 [Puniceicoccaceae bacterium K14]|nr:hypothetical protein [Puniceicoccaceae bacterium K14]
MGLFNIFRRPATVFIGDCLSRKITPVSELPVVLNGKSKSGQRSPLCRINQIEKRFFIESLDENNLPLLDGDPVETSRLLTLDRLYSLTLHGHILALTISRAESPFSESFSSSTWIVSKRDSPINQFKITDEHLNRAILSRKFTPLSNYLVSPQGVDASFNLADLYELLPENVENQDTPQKTDYGVDAASLENPRSGHTCPNCWKSFAISDVMNIATHDSLIGDPELGSHVKLRFKAERFNDLGQALDSEGLVSLDLACPHCRGRLPPSFLSQDQLIFSLVGAPSSGKSYYLSILLKCLPEDLIRHFGTNLQDADPNGNIGLNEMKNRLFSATTPEDAFISKTDFEGLMYERLKRNGKLVPLPRPFVYNLQDLSNPEKRAALIFYDNAGEHFQPTVSLDDSPGALHVAASSALFFLFDPATSRPFRKALADTQNIQFSTQSTDEQDVILSEMGIRVKKIRGKESYERIDTPLAIIVGKYDLWKDLLPTDQIRTSKERPLSDEDISANSKIVRELLLRLCPTIVANAESISSQTMYFPSSPLGHSPTEIHEGPLAGKIAPVPELIDPTLVTEPALWALSKIIGDKFKISPTLSSSQ